MEKANFISVSAPGRICLFGEHQDYFGLPVISAAINLRIKVEGKKLNQSRLIIRLPDINREEEIDLFGDCRIKGERDYLRSSLNVLKEMGFKFKDGYECEITSDIPIAKGVASSSALVVSWIRFLITISEKPRELSLKEIASTAYRAEVLEFGEPGGMQDHFCASMGEMLYIDCGKETDARVLKSDLHEFVLVDSLEQKDTRAVLSRIKNHVYKAINIVKEEIGEFDLREIVITNKVDEILAKLPEEVSRKFRATLRTRDLTKKVNEAINKKDIREDDIGRWLDEHHRILRDGLEISTVSIERLIKVAKNAGALGCKINGSGGGWVFPGLCSGERR